MRTACVCPQVYMKFIIREVEVPGKDLCDMSGAQGRTPDEFTGEHTDSKQPAHG